MQIKIIGKELKVTEAINDYVERKNWRESPNTLKQQKQKLL